MMGTPGALAALGGDMSFTVSYAVASELRTSAVQSGMADYELIAFVLLTAVVLSAVPSSARRIAQVGAVTWKHTRISASQQVPAWLVRGVDWLMGVKAKSDKSDKSDNSDAVDALDGPRSYSFIAFLELLVATGRRIAVALLVQLVAASAVVDQTVRLDRILALISVAVFFIFLQSGASAVNVPA